MCVWEARTIPLDHPWLTCVCCRIISVVALEESDSKLCSGHMMDGKLVIGARIGTETIQLVPHGQSSMADGVWHFVTLKQNETRYIRFRREL